MKNWMCGKEDQTNGQSTSKKRQYYFTQGSIML